jgi:hypothetical protein
VVLELLEIKRRGGYGGIAESGFVEGEGSIVIVEKEDF